MTKLVTSRQGITRLARLPEHVLGDSDFFTSPRVTGLQPKHGDWLYLSISKGMTVNEVRAQPDHGDWLLAGQTIGDTVLDMFDTVKSGRFVWRKIVRLYRDRNLVVMDGEGTTSAAVSHVGGCGCDFIHYLKKHPYSLTYTTRNALLQQLRDNTWRL